MSAQEIPDWMIDASSIPKAEALQTIARDLPAGWQVQINLECGSGSVTLFDPQDNLFELETTDGMEAAMLEALRFSKFRESETEATVNRAWARFQEEMTKQNGVTPGMISSVALNSVVMESAQIAYEAYCMHAATVDEEGLSCHAFHWSQLDPGTQACWVAVVKRLRSGEVS